MIDLKEDYEKLKIPLDGASPLWFQNRGRTFEKIIKRVLEREEFNPQASYRTLGEQIDGSFIYNGRVFLLEAKWHKDELPASSIYAFKGKVDGKLVGTIGIYISMSGYLTDTINALSHGKSINILLFNESDMDAVLDPEIGFRKVLEFKLRSAAEEGMVFSPYELISAIKSKSPFYILCECEIDKFFIKLINKKLGKSYGNLEQKINVIQAGGLYNLPKIADSLLSHLDEKSHVLVVADSGIGKDQIEKVIFGRINYPNLTLVLPNPSINVWLFSDPKEFDYLKKNGSKSQIIEEIRKKTEELDVEKLSEKDLEFRKYIETIHDFFD